MANPARKPAAERRRRAPKVGDNQTEKRPKRSQRERLLDAMIALATQVGYQQVSIAQVSAKAGVSRATFYEQFDDKEDCLLAAYRTAAERLLAHALPVTSDGHWSEAAADTLRQLADALRRDPDAGRLLFVERLAGGARARETRRMVIDAFEQRVQEFIDSTPQGAETLDVPPSALVGAVRSIVARYLRTHGEDELPALADDGIVWVRSYAVAAGREHWSTSPDALLPAPPEPEPPPTSRRRPRRLPRGRHGLPAGVIARSQRTRIIYGTAEVMMAKGYESATVTDIVAAAGVSREVFYEHFSDKQNAFLEAQQHPTQHILDACASAYFSVRDWPERVWNTFAALLWMIAANPGISHLRLVECYAAGPEAIRRAEEITRSFTIFLEEGYSYRPEARELPHLCSHAIAGSVFEVIQRHVARGDSAGLVRRLPQLTYVAIAPFTGPEEAVRLVSALKAGYRAPALNDAGR
jgi:AcrR family transcriptional regulator